MGWNLEERRRGGGSGGRAGGKAHGLKLNADAAAAVAPILLHNLEFLDSDSDRDEDVDDDDSSEDPDSDPCDFPLLPAFDLLENFLFFLLQFLLLVLVVQNLTMEFHHNPPNSYSLSLSLSL